MPKNKPGRAPPRAPSFSSTSTIYFYLPNDPPYGVFSQWYPSAIVVPTSSLVFLAITPSTRAILDAHSTPPPTQQTTTCTPKGPTHQALHSGPTITFTSAEQLHTFSKALLFAAAPTAAAILATSDPKRQKALGRAVPQFNEFKWTRVKSRVVEVGNWYKFTQDETLRGVLVGTGERELVEASKGDRVWGCGFGEGEAEERRAEWGENRLGKALERVRGRIRGLEGERWGGSGMGCGRGRGRWRVEYGGTKKKRGRQKRGGHDGTIRLPRRYIQVKSRGQIHSAYRID